MDSSPGSCISIRFATIFRRRLDWLRFRSIGQPLFQEQGCSGAVQSPTAISVQAMALPSGPAAAVLVHKSHRKCQCASQPDSVALTVSGLHGGVSLVIEWETNHQRLHPTFSTELLQLPEVVAERTTVQGIEWCDSQSQGVAACQSDAFAAHIKAQC